MIPGRSSQRMPTAHSNAASSRREISASIFDKAGRLRIRQELGFVRDVWPRYDAWHWELWCVDQVACVEYPNVNCNASLACES